MKSYYRLLVPALLLVAASCGTKNGGTSIKKGNDLSEIKAPSEKAHVHYLKKSDKEYVFLKGKDLKDYTVISEEDSLYVNVRGKKISGKADLDKKSRLIRGISTESSTEGSKVELNLKSRQGFKIYRRPSGLLLAMGPGYQEISESDLESLDAEISSSSSIDEDLDKLLMDNGPSEMAATPQSADSDKELDALMNELDSEASSTAAVTPAMEEQLIVEEDMGKSTTIENIKIEKLGEKVQVSIRGDRAVKYKQKPSPKGYNQIIVDIPNAKLSSKAQQSIDTSVSNGVITSVTPYELKGPYKTVRVVVQMSDDVKTELMQKGNTIFVSVPEQAEEVSTSYAQQEPELERPSDINAARQLSRASFEDYLSKPTRFYGKRMSIEVANADVLDVLRMIQEVGAINIVVSDSVKGKVNISLKNVPWDQALSVVLQNAQLGYVMQGSVIRVAPLADLRDERKVAAEALEAHNQLEPLRIMVARLNYISSKEAEQKIGALLSNRGKVAVDKDAKTVVIHDIEEVIFKADKLLKSIDTKPVQVAIEANIIEASDSWIRAMGFSWATDSGDIGFKNISGLGNISAMLGIASVKGDVKIVSSPKISAIDRTTASILQGTQVAYKTTVSSASGDMSDKIEFENIQVSMNVTPRVTDNGEVMLDVDVKREFPDYMFRMSRKMPPGIGVRRAASQIMLKDGDTAVIGGLYSIDSGESGAGVPLIRVVPIVGWFFGKEEDREVKSELIIFIKASVKKDS